jgi:hypothetical protein
MERLFLPSKCSSMMMQTKKQRYVHLPSSTALWRPEQHSAWICTFQSRLAQHPKISAIKSKHFITFLKIITCANVNILVYIKRGLNIWRNSGYTPDLKRREEFTLLSYETRKSLSSLHLLQDGNNPFHRWTFCTAQVSLSDPIFKLNSGTWACCISTPIFHWF